MKKKILLLVAALAAMVGLLMPGAVYATDGGTGNGEATGEDAFCKNVKNTSSPAYNSLCGGAKGEADAEAVVKDVLNVVFTWVGIIAVIVIIVGGVLYMTAQGDPGKLAHAKNAIMFAVIGLIVALLSFAIVNFVLDRMKGA